MHANSQKLFCFKLNYFEICNQNRHQPITCNIVPCFSVIFVLRAYAKEQLIAMGATYDLMHKLVDKLIDGMTHHTDLDNTTLGKPGRKPGHVATSFQNFEVLSPKPRPLFSQPRPLFQNPPTPVKSSRLQSI